MRIRRRLTQRDCGPSSGGTTGKLARCQVGSSAGRLCPNPAAVEIQGVPFCEQCAREQEAYFAIGELTQELANDRTKWTRDFVDERLIETLYRMRWELDERNAETEKQPEVVKR